ncbi:hypothetical protein F5Y16DRAFT_21622 [Xylariaceae sp. FL0255]|nr:hypothetical protein F5Y16DRAFT_21622 [Xylariaceae sp. FL0255]
MSPSHLEDQQNALEVFRDAMTLANVYLMQDDSQSAQCCVQLLICCLQLYGFDVVYGHDHRPPDNPVVKNAIIDLKSPSSYTRPEEKEWLADLLRAQLYDDWYAFELLIRLATELELIDQTEPAHLAYRLAKKAVERCRHISLDTLQNFIEWLIFFVTAQIARGYNEDMILSNIRWCRDQIQRMHLDDAIDTLYWDNILMALYSLMEDVTTGDEQHYESLEAVLDSGLELRAQELDDSKTDSSDEFMAEWLSQNKSGRDELGHQRNDGPQPDGLYRRYPSSSTSNLATTFDLEPIQAIWSILNDGPEVEKDKVNEYKAGIIRRTSMTVRRSLSWRKARSTPTTGAHRDTQPDRYDDVKHVHTLKALQNDSSFKLRSTPHMQEDRLQHTTSPKLGEISYEKEIVKVAHSFQLYKKHKIVSEPRPLPEWREDINQYKGVRKGMNPEPIQAPPPGPPKKEGITRRRLQKKCRSTVT